MDAILVTGGAGYIGSHACKALSKSGFLPIAFDDLQTGHGYAVKWGPLIQGDLSDLAKLKETLKTYTPKAVLHFAANALVSESIANPCKIYRNNLVSSLSLLEAMRNCGVLNLIFSSTCAIYGNPQSTPIAEDHPKAPISPYGRSKLMIEEIIADCEKAHGIKCVSLRYFNVAGADTATEIGEDHDPETHLIPSVIQAALGKRRELTVYGTDFPSIDGTAMRDYVHVQDLANAHVAALKWLLTNQKSIAVNLGAGRSYSVLEIIDAVQKFCGQTVPVRFEKRREGDPSVLTADNKRAFEIFGWTPLLSDLPNLIESAWKWHKFLAEKDPQ